VTRVAEFRGAASALELHARLYPIGPSFLCESLGEPGRRSRYSFLGGRPDRIVRAWRDRVEATAVDRGARVARGSDADTFLGALRAELSAVERVGVPPFAGGLVGYIGYDVARRFERLENPPPGDAGLPDAVLLVPREVIVVDHVAGTTTVVAHDPVASGRFDEMAEAVRESLTTGERPFHSRSPGETRPPRVLASSARPEFQRGVERLIEHIRAGDIFQGVLSRRFDVAVEAEPAAIYRALRRWNPAPYMYFLRLDEASVIGSSPEALVTLEGRTARSRPLAGTRSRGRSAEEDAALSRELLADEKERAEHTMLVDLARNDLGRVCRYGSVRVTSGFEIERHARVMHIVSEVEGVLRDDADAFDLLRATFPAGTVTGAPKIRAMELIDELEPAPRGVYGGAIGYIDASGRMDLALAIRTVVARPGHAIVQAGAGVVADSRPSAEFDETEAKASALLAALGTLGPREATEEEACASR
jgi:anthranilate synthase component 1